jgi:ribosomal protein L34
MLAYPAARSGARRLPLGVSIHMASVLGARVIMDTREKGRVSLVRRHGFIAMRD